MKTCTIRNSRKDRKEKQATKKNRKEKRITLFRLMYASRVISSCS